MDPEHPALDEIVAAIVAGEELDWTAVERAATGDVRSMLPSLKVLAQIRHVHGDLPREAAWGPLRLLEHVGSGSFGEVYRAWDERLAREVALKLLWPAASTTAGSGVIDEGRRLARVRHPNVVTVFGADHADGRIGIWTEFVRGQTLADRSRLQGALDAGETARIGVVLCDALAAVHRAGVVHGDIKAANVMREEDGRIVLMDFGAGREFAHRRHHETVAGTPLYAAPEVLAGSAATPAGDIYSLGVLLYQLLTREYPVPGATVREIQEAHASGRRARVAEAWPAVPRALASCIDRALSARPEDRFPTAIEMASALRATLPEARPGPTARVFAGSPRTTWIAAAAAAIALVSQLADPKPGLPVRNRTEQASVLITAFDNRTGDPRLDGALEHVLARELDRAAIATVGRARVEESLRLMKLPVATPLEPAIGHELALRDGGIDAVLAGRIDRLGDQYVLAIEAAVPGTGTVLLRAAERSPDAEGLLGAMEGLAGRVRMGLGGARQTLAGEPPLEKVATRSLRALQLYTAAAALGHERSANTQDQWASAAELLRSALQEDPDFASAHILRAIALHFVGRPPPEFLAHAERAVALADSAPEAERYFVLGTNHALRQQHAEAIPYYESLLRVNPSHYWGAHFLALMYESTGRLREAVPYIVRRADLRPRDEFDNIVAAETLTIWAHQPQRARVYVDRVRALLAEGNEPWRSVGWIRAFPAIEHWLGGDVLASSAAVDEVARELPALADRDRDRLALIVIHLYLALGRIDAAEQVAGSLSETFGGPARGLAWVALARQDDPDVRRHLDAVCALPFWPAGGLGLGALVGADRCLRRLSVLDDDAARNPDPLVASEPQVIRGLVALRQRRFGEAERRLSAAAMGQRLGGPSYLLAREGLSRVLEATGKVHESAQVLEATDKYMSVPWRGQPAGALWLRQRLRLADTYRRLGRIDEARSVEEDLRRMLAAADTDHPMRTALSTRD